MVKKRILKLPRKLSGREKALKILGFVLEKKAENPIIIDIREFTHFCDYFIVCSGTSQRHARAIYEEVIKLSKKNKIGINHFEKDVSSIWLLIDYFDIVLHIFTEETRKFYALEHLWREAKRVKLPKGILAGPSA